MEWLENLSDSIEYLENHLDQSISFDEAAKIACCSTYYFQRMFSYVDGIPLSDYIRRRRITQAAFELQSANKKVLDIALKYGYTPPTSFNRFHGISPAAAKKPGAALNAFAPIRFSVQVTGASALFPADTLSPGVKLFVHMNPFAHAVDALRALILSPSVAYESLAPVCFPARSIMLHQLRTGPACPESGNGSINFMRLS